MNPSPRAGDVVADRFVIVSLAGQGGMGSVYRATDKMSGETIALKMVERAGTGITEERFRREAKALAAISHPAVARYIAEGSTPRFLWLAMEWLEGEDLQARIDREPIDAGRSVALAARVAEGIAEAHRVGVVHRDLKPSNLLLLGGDERQVKIIDFGVARVSERARPLTRTGQMIGTVGFMAPEQIHGERDVDERADVFALGAVLFEMITGRPAFQGASLIAIIAKVLREDPPRISAVGPPVPQALDELVEAMMAKPRDARPSSMAMVAARLREIERDMGASAPQPRPAALSSVTGREQRLVSVLLVVPLAVDGRGPSTIDEGGLTDDATESFLDSETMIDEATEAGESAGPQSVEAPRAPRVPLGDAVYAAADEAGADAIALGEGTFLVVVSAGGTAKDQAARAASCALALRDRGDCRAVVGTGLAEPTGGLPVGPAIDRAAQLIDAGDLGGVALDDVTAALLDDGFQIDRTASPPLLLAFGEKVASPRKGGTTPFVGRDKEMAMIDAMLAECFDEPVARVVVVTGPPGAGKSRLRLECLRRAEARPGLFAIVARAHQVGSGAALGFVRSIVEQLLAVPEGGSHREKRLALEASLGTLYAGLELVHARDFLGELIGCPVGDGASAELVAARGEPRGLAEWLRRSFVDLVVRSAEQRALLVILEDLHWGDDASVEFIAEALRRASALPVFVLALARPEVWDALPRLQSAWSPQEIKLAGLTPKAAQRLLESVLGKAATPALIADLVARAEGNPFFLEELGRGAAFSLAEGSAEDGQAGSETVLAVVQSRIQRLEPEARRLLRAASVFGREFTLAGVARMLAEDASSPDLTSLLDYADDRHMIERTTRAHGFRFRHDLLRDAVYAMIPASERASAHLVAAEWLVAAEADPSVLAEHFERAELPLRAVPWLLRAAEDAQNGGSYERVGQIVARAVAAGATGETLGLLQIYRAFACAWLHDWRACQDAAREAVAVLQMGSTPWFRAAAAYTFAAISLGDGSAIGALSKSVLELAQRAEPTGAFAFAANATLLVLSLVGRLQESLAIVALLDAKGDAPGLDPAFGVWRALAHAHMDMTVGGNPASGRRWLAIAAGSIPSLADSVASVVHRYFSALAACDLGDLDASIAGARRIIDAPSAESVPYMRSWSQHLLGRCLLDAGRIAEARAVAEGIATTHDALFRQRALGLLARIQHAAGERAAARSTATQLLAGTFVPQDVAIGRNVLARLACDEGALEEAEQHAAAAAALVDQYGLPNSVRSALAVARVLIARARGDEGLAGAVLGAERARFEGVASMIDDPDVRRTYLATADIAWLRGAATNR